MPLSTVATKNRKTDVWLKSFFMLSFAFLLSFLSYQLLYEGKVTTLKSIQDQKLFTASALFSRELGSLEDLATLLLNNMPVNNDTHPPSLLSAKTRQQVESYFVRFGKISKKMAQIRWLDEAGNEMIRVDFSEGLGTIAPIDKLQNKRSRYYFSEGMNVTAPEVYFSPIDLNVEQQKIVQPYEPTIRASIQTTNSTHLLPGLLVINYRLSHLFAEISQLSIAQAQMSIINNEGFWLLSQYSSKEWGFMLGQPQLTLKNESPELWKQIEKRKHLGAMIVEEQLSRYVQLNIFTANNSVATNNNLILLATSDKEILQLAGHQYLACALILFIVLSFFCLLVNCREYRYENQLVQLSIALRDEQQSLKKLNQSLIKNIERQQLLQNELVEANKLSSLGLMVAGVAHELNTPIGGAIISVSNADRANDKLKIAFQKGITKNQFSDGVALINNSLGLAKINLDKAVNQIKHFKRLAIDRVNEDLVNCLLEEIVDDLLGSLHHKLKNVKIKITVDIEPNITLTSRPGIISQTLENLITNSLNHGFSQGEEGNITIKAHKVGDDQICICVADNGSGIPISMQKDILEPFVTSGRGQGNIGLGLYMVNQWVTKLLVGKLSFISEKNSHREFTTQFTILLPMNFSQSLQPDK